jgi:hypothetical protein
MATKAQPDPDREKFNTFVILIANILLKQQILY